MVVAAHVGRSLMQQACDCGNKPGQTRSNSKHPWLGLLTHVGSLFCFWWFCLVWSASKQQSIMQFWRCNCGDDVIPRWGANIRALQYPIRCVIQCDSAWYDITAHHYRYYSVFLSDSERVGLTLGGRAYSWTSWMKNMLLLSGWCSMPAPLPDLCWPKLWWSIIGLLMSWAMEAASLLKRQKATPVNMHSANAWGWCRQFARQHGDESITGYCQGFASCTCSSTPRPVPICLHPAVTWQNLWDSYFF